MRITNGVRGSTMVETLVMMLVAGIVFLSVMDGLRLFTHLQTRRTGELLAAGQERDGYFRIVTLLAAADSVLEDGEGLAIYRHGRTALLDLRDSALIYHTGEFRDTLLRGVAGVQVERYPSQSDTVVIGFGSGYAAKLPLFSPARSYREALDQIENGYGYEE